MRSARAHSTVTITVAGTSIDTERFLDHLAARVAKKILRIAGQSGTISGADESPRRGKEREGWRDEEMGTESSALTANETNGESLSLREEVKELVVSLRRKARRAERKVWPSRRSRRSTE